MLSSDTLTLVTGDWEEEDEGEYKGEGGDKTGDHTSE